MLHVDTQASISGRFHVRVGGAVRGASIASKSFDEIGLAVEATRHRIATDKAASEAREDALQHAAKALSDAAVRLDEARERAEEALPGDAVALGVEIARQILKIKVEAGEYGLEEIVRSTLAASEIKRGTCIVQVHPDDAASLAETVFREGTEMLANPAVPRGCVEIDTPRGLLVRDLNAALDEIHEQLLEDLV